MPNIGAGSYHLMGEALGEALHKTSTLTSVQCNSVIYAFADRLKAEKQGFELERFIEQVQAYIELAHQVDESTPDFEETDEPE